MCIRDRVWIVLGAIKTEFGKFGEALEATRRKLEQATRSIESAGVRTRQIERKLKGVEALPIIAVSYTHLDVYKRQPIRRDMMIDKAKLQTVLHSPKTKKYAMRLVIAFVVVGVLGFFVLPPLVLSLIHI